MGFIYKIQNKENSKIYIGKTVNTIHERWMEHVLDAENGDDALLHRAIRKYGKDNFYIDEVEKCSCDILNEREQHYIQLFHSHCREGGYNMTFGGEGALKYSDREILSLWEQGMRANEIAEALKANPNTISQRLKLLLEDGAVRKRYTDSRKKSVIQYSFDGVPIQQWESANLAEKSLGLSAGQVSKCCNFKAVMAGGFLWKFSTDETPIIRLQERYAESPLCRDVNLIDDNGTVLRTFSSGKEAELELGLARGLVSAVCNKTRKHTRNYKFEWGNPIKRRIVNDKINRNAKSNS